MPPNGRLAVVSTFVLTGDRGLAGAFNSQVLREAFAVERRLRSEGIEPRWLVSGKWHSVMIYGLLAGEER